jgi:DNA-binding HxlR family transcriptional regulator
MRDARSVLPVDELLRWVERASTVLAGRWKSAILWLLIAQPRRYNEFVRALPGISPKVLTHQLRELERDGILTRDARQAGPKHVVYSLTPLGAQLGPVLAALECWARDHHAWRAAASGRCATPVR